MSYQLKGLQVSLVIHAAVFALIFGIRISAVNLSRPILIEFGIIEGSMDSMEHHTEKSNVPQQKRKMIKSIGEEAVNRIQTGTGDARVKKDEAFIQTKEELLPIKKEREEQHNEQIAPGLSDAQVPIAATGAFTSSDVRSQSSPSAESIISADSKPISGKSSGVASDSLQFGSAAGPKFLHKVLPIYPAAAKKTGKEGKVVMKMTIDEQGNLVNIEVIEHTGHGFAEAAIDAMKRSTFLPAKMHGTPMPSKAMLTIRFSMRKDQ
jgi:protein TonB